MYGVLSDSPLLHRVKSRVMQEAFAESLPIMKIGEGESTIENKI